MDEPDDFDQMGDVDPDAYADMMAEMEASEYSSSSSSSSSSAAGQSAPRKLDFRSYGQSQANTLSMDDYDESSSSSLSIDADVDSGPMSSSQIQPSQSRHVPSSSSLSSSSFRPAPSTPAASPPMTHFQREQLVQRLAAEKDALASETLRRAVDSENASVAGMSGGVMKRNTSSGANGVMMLTRSISDARAATLNPPDSLYVYKRAPALGGSCAITSSSGERLFLSTSIDPSKPARTLRRQTSTLTSSRAMSSMLASIDAAATAASEASSRALAAARVNDSDPEDDERTRVGKRRKRKEKLIQRFKDQEEEVKRGLKNSKLWVDKYAPKKYGDLLSPELINREVLEWLKGWDACVFGDRLSTDAVAGAVTSLRTIDSQLLSSTLMAAPLKKAKTRTKAEGDAVDIRPVHKVILLCGPPGLGKTTLAHILARHAGYHALELNASDDRTAGILEERVRSAVENRSVSFGSGHSAKPNCVIIDEIDGVAGEVGGGTGAIAALIRIITAETKVKSATKRKAGTKGDNDEEDDDGSESDADDDEEASSKPARSKSRRAAVPADGDAPVTIKRSPPQSLKRPIICICNDQYALALRPLRAIARVFEFTPAPKAKFVSRLQDIAKSEGMLTDARTLAALAEVVDMDIRSALNTLQFAHSKGQKLTADSLNNMSVGRKDVEKSRFQVWDAVFTQRDSRAGAKDRLLRLRDGRETDAVNNRSSALGLGGLGVAAQAPVQAEQERTRELHALLQDAGDAAQVMQGIFHNYPSTGYTDPSFAKTHACAEWIAFGDILEHKIHAEVEFALSAYTPYAALAIHSLTARARQGKVQLEAPSMYYLQHLEQLRSGNILRSFLSASNSFAKLGSTISQTSLDILPHVVDILHPPTLRAVGSVAMLSGAERGELGNLVDTMIRLSVTFRPEAANFASSGGTSWQNRSSGGGGGASADAIQYKLDPPLEIVCEWSDPLDPLSARRFEPRDKHGAVIVKAQSKFPPRAGSGFGAKGVNANGPAAAAAFKIDKRSVHMSSKVRAMLVRELEFETMRRSETKWIEANAKKEEEQSEGGGAAGKEAKKAHTPSRVVDKPASSHINPGLQKILDESSRKRAGLPPSSAASHPSSSSSSSSAIEDESPATKRARVHSSNNFLHAHADHAKHQQRARGQGIARAGAGAAASMANMNGLKTDKQIAQERDAMNDSPAASSDIAAAASSSSSSSATSAPRPHLLHFKYNEGCTNAVRRTVSVGHFAHD